MEDGRLRRVLKDKIGINLEADKRYLLESRLKELMQSHRLETFDQIAEKIEVENDASFLNQVIDRITTRETRFFRDEHIFESFARRIYKEHAINPNGGGGPVRIWSAGCSSGQEPCSIAISLLEHLGSAMHPFLIDASDISEEALKKARSGVYSSFELSRGVTDVIRDRYFEPAGDDFRVREDILSRIHYTRVNFLNLLPGGPYDVIFFRNVAIYFEEETRRRIFEALYQSLRPGGVLILGSTETAISYLEEMRIVEVNIARFYIR